MCLSSLRRTRRVFFRSAEIRASVIARSERDGLGVRAVLLPRGPRILCAAVFPAAAFGAGIFDSSGSMPDGVLSGAMRQAARLSGDGADDSANDDEFHSSLFAARACCAGTLVGNNARQKLISAHTCRDAALGAASGGEAVAVAVMADGSSRAGRASGLDESDDGDGEDGEDAFHVSRFATPGNLRV